MISIWNHSSVYLVWSWWENVRHEVDWDPLLTYTTAVATYLCCIDILLQVCVCITIYSNCWCGFSFSLAACSWTVLTHVIKASPFYNWWTQAPGPLCAPLHGEYRPPCIVTACIHACIRRRAWESFYLWGLVFISCTRMCLSYPIVLLGNFRCSIQRTPWLQF